MNAPHLVTFDYAALSVENLPVARRFFAEMFDLCVVEAELETEELHAVILRSPTGSLGLELIRASGSVRREPGGPHETVRVRTWSHIALRVSDVDELADRAAECGGRIVVPPRPATRPGYRFAYIADPEDNLIELVCRVGSSE